MKKELLTQLVEKTFAKLATPTPGTGLYSELKNVINQAFELGSHFGPDNEEPDSTNSLFSPQPPAENIFHHTAIAR
jgi:hypothetical protein